MSSPKVRFHIAHLYEVSNRIKTAKELYEQLLQEKDLPPLLKADIYRQLGKKRGHSNRFANAANRARHCNTSVFFLSFGALYIGWMHHSVESLGERNQRELFAIQSLQQAIEADHKSGQSLYLLGRCYASIGKVHEAFLAYRNSVDKTEGNADTWCSIGYVFYINIPIPTTTK